jgi:hypothetical protein
MVVKPLLRRKRQAKERGSVESGRHGVDHSSSWFPPEYLAKAGFAGLDLKRLHGAVEKAADLLGSPT